MQAFVLAGGFATRLWPLTEKRAKPLLPLAGKTLLTHLVEKIPEGIPVTVSTNAVFAEDFEKWKTELHASRPFDFVQDRLSARHPEELLSGAKERLEGESRPPQHDVSILIEDAGHEDEKLGALGAVAKWISENKIEDDVLLLAGDNYVGFSIEEFLKKYEGNPLLAAYDVKDKEQAKLFGTVITEGTRVIAFEEKPQEPKSTLVSTGVILLPKESLSTLVNFAKEQPDHIGGIFEHFLAEEMTVDCAPFQELWFDIGSFEAYIEATTKLVGENVLKGEHVEEKGNTFEGSIVIGNRSKVHGSTLTNVVLFEDCQIENCVLENCILDNHCTLRNIELHGKMLREGTRLVHAIRA